MKTAYFSLIFSFVLLFSCKQSAIIKSPLLDLERDPSHTLYHIDYINGQLMSDQSPKKILVQGEFLEIQGWAVDVKAGDVPENIYFQVGEKQFENTLITKRQDVANALNMKKAVNAGYSFKIPLQQIGKGVLETKLIIVKNDNKGYYAPDPSKTIELEIVE